MENNKQQQPTKKPRVLSISDEEEDDTPLLLRALEICYQNRLPQDLDLVEVAMLRLTSRGCGNIAARMAKDRMKNHRLGYQVQVSVNMKKPSGFMFGMTTFLQSAYLNSVASLQPKGDGTKFGKHAPVAAPDDEEEEEERGVHEWDWETLPKEEKQARMEAGTSNDVFIDSLRLSVEVTTVVDSLGENSADKKWITDATKENPHCSYIPKLVFPLLLGDPAQLELGTSLFTTGRAGGEGPMEALKLEWEILTSTVQTIQAANDGDNNEEAQIQDAETIHHRGSFRIKSVTWDFLTLLTFVLYHKENALNKIKEDKGDTNEPLTKEEEQLQRVVDLAETIFPPYFRLYDGV